jgi:hypothetical protein
MSPSAFVSDPVAWLARLLRAAPGLRAPLEALPLWALAALLGLGGFVLVAGARWRRPLGAAGGAAAGAVAGLGVGGLLGLSAGYLPLAGAAAVGGAALVLPSLFPFAAGALPGAFLGALAAPSGAPWLGAIIGSFLLGGLGLLWARLVAAASAGAMGAGLVGAALLGAAGRVPALAPLARWPALLAGLLAVLAIAGAAFQASVAWGSGAAAGSASRGPAPARGMDPGRPIGSA